MRLLLFFILFIAHCKTFAQRIYLSADEFQTSKASAHYYRDITQSGAGYLVETYYVSSGKLQSRMTCSSVNPRPIKNGIATTYYENGNVKSIEHYEAGNMTGLNSYFTEKGDSSSLTFCRKTGDSDEPFKKIYIQIWNTEGKPVLNKGTGIHQESTQTGNITFSHYVDSILTHSYKIDVNTHDTVYMVAEKGIEFPEGITKFYEYIGKNLHYPTKARFKGIQGRVFIEFIVEPNGSITNAKVLKGIGGGCDEEALRTLTSYKLKFSPAYHAGRPVRSVLVLPFTFILS